MRHRGFGHALLLGDGVELLLALPHGVVLVPIGGWCLSHDSSLSSVVGFGVPGGRIAEQPSPPLQEPVPLEPALVAAARPVPLPFLVEGVRDLALDALGSRDRSGKRWHASKVRLSTAAGNGRSAQRL